MGMRPPAPPPPSNYGGLSNWTGLQGALNFPQIRENSMNEPNQRAERKKLRAADQQWTAARRAARQRIYDTFTAFRAALVAERQLLDSNPMPGQELTFGGSVGVAIRKARCVPNGWQPADDIVELMPECKGTQHG